MKIIHSIFLITLTLIMPVSAIGNASPMEMALNSGPRTEDLIIKFYGNLESAYSALKSGDIDIIGDLITSDLYADAIDDPNIVLDSGGDRGMYEFDLNNNCTATDLNDGRRSPTNYLDFRRGIAFCVDKDLVVDTFCGGFADRIDQPIAYLQRGWRNTSCWYEDGTYPYEYNLVDASAAFDAAGFVQGTDANPDYNPGIPGSAQYLRIHPDKGDTMNLLETCIRSDDARRLEAGRALCDALRLCGVPVNQYEADSSAFYTKIMDNHDYHVYTGGWSLGRFPGVTLYGLYHSSQHSQFPPSPPPLGVNCNGLPNYPLLDQLLYKARFPENYDDSRESLRNALGYGWGELCVNIPLFSARSYYAWSNNLLGVVNAEEIGPINRYTLMNALKVSGGPIRYGIIQAPKAMNKIYSSYHSDYQCLDRMDLYSHMDIPPYDQSVDQAGYILNWTTSTWNDNGVSKTKISRTYRDDAWFVEPVTGNQLEHINATHHYASIWYEYQLSTAWNHDSVSDIKYVDITAPYSYDIYWNVTSYWNTYLGVTSIKSFNWWSKGNLSQTVTETLTSDGSGWLGCTEAVFFVLSIEQGGTPLVQGPDYRIEMDPDGPHNADVHILNGTYIGVSIDITYLATDDAEGYYPGGLSWQDVFEGAGMYYATDFVPGISGYLMLKGNSYYYMETPPLGEIDFLKKQNGCYKIDIFDIVKAIQPYGSCAQWIPDPSYFAGADLAPTGGKVDIFDLVTITGKYGTEWDC